MRLAQDCVGAWVVGISPPTVLGWFPRLAPTRAPPLRPATPCHYMSGNRPTTRRRPDGSGSRSVGHVVARGGVGGGWALAGARPRGAARCMGAPKLSGREDLAAGTNKSRRATIKAHPSAPPHPRPYVHNRRCANKLCAYGVLPMLFVTLHISSVIGRR